MEVRRLRARVVPVDAVAALAAWLAGVAATAWAWDSLLPAAGATRLRRVASAVLAGWVIEGFALAALAIAGAAITPFAAVAPAPVAVLLVYRKRPRPAVVSERFPRLGTVPIALLAIAGVRLGVHVWHWPWSQPWSWDVYAVWGFKARFLVRTGGLWRYLSLGPHYPFSSPDYPPLWAAQVAAVSWPAGNGCHAAVPDLVLLLAALVLLLELWRVTAGATAGAALMLLAVWPAFPSSAALVGLADRPLAMLAAVAVAIALAPAERRDPRLLAVALAGLALVKDEGLPFAALLAAAAWLASGRRRDVAGAALGLTPAVAWHLATAALARSSERLTRLVPPVDPGSAVRLVLGAAAKLVSIPDWTVSEIAALLGAIVLLAAPRRRWVAAAVCAQAAVLVFAVIASPYPLAWQISTALPRLTAQLLVPGLACLAGVAAWLAAPPHDADLHGTSA